MIAGIISPETTRRPILIDEKDGPCEYCAAWESRKQQRPRLCCRCGEGIAIYQNMGGAGFQSPRPHHFHLQLVADLAGRQAIHEELCLACYNAAWRDAYPTEPVPAPPLELTEPKLPKEITAPVDGVTLTTGTPMGMSPDPKDLRVEERVTA